jgi:hypothetical protein
MYIKYGLSFVLIIRNENIRCYGLMKFMTVQIGYNYSGYYGTETDSPAATVPKAPQTP